jgi:mannose-6-phosphate isomerase-like protein (cupin superfamily)
MEVVNVEDRKDTKIETFPYKGKKLPVRDVWIRWLSQAGPKDAPDYGLRFFTMGPQGEIPIHNHFYHQTMYIVSGQIRCMCHDPKTDQVVMERVVGPNDYIYVPSMEPHSMVNMSETEKATFLCCIANVYEDEGL